MSRAAADESRAAADEFKLDQFGAASDAQLFHDFAHVLGVVAMCDQQRILCVHNHQVLHADQRDKFLRAEDVVVAGFDGDVAG